MEHEIKTPSTIKKGDVILYDRVYRTVRGIVDHGAGSIITLEQDGDKPCTVSVPIHAVIFCKIDGPSVTAGTK